MSAVPSSAVESPAHYTQGKANGWETIEVIRNELSPEAFRGFLLGNVFKYASRHDRKNGVEDLRKARWYLDRMIEESGGAS